MGDLQLDLNRYPIFSNTTPDERGEVLKLVEFKNYNPGDVILAEGKSIQMLWIIVAGRCKVVKTMKNDTEQQFAVLQPGAVFGEMSFFHPAPHSATVRALDEVEVMCLSRENYDKLREAAPSAASKITFNTASVLAERLRQMDDWTCEMVECPDVESHREEWREFRSKLYTEWEF